MGPDKLECLLESFIASRSITDTIDGITASAVHRSGLIDDCDGPSLFSCNVNRDSHQSNFPERYQVGGGNLVAHGHSQSQIGAVQSTQITELGRYLADLANQFSTNRLNDSCVKFEKLCMIVPPDEHTFSITVIRSPRFQDAVTKVSWKTVDKTALSDTHYVASSGEIVFDKGVMKQTIPIKILKTSDEAMDLRFHVEMCVINEEGCRPKTMTVTLKRLDKFYDDERQVLQSLPYSIPFTVEDIKSALDISLNSRTFHMALTHLCSAANSVHLEFALALELSRLCLPNLERPSILKVLKDFFRREDID